MEASRSAGSFFAWLQAWLPAWRPALHGPQRWPILPPPRFPMLRVRFLAASADPHPFSCDACRSAPILVRRLPLRARTFTMPASPHPYSHDACISAPVLTWFLPFHLVRRLTIRTRSRAKPASPHPFSRRISAFFSSILAATPKSPRIAAEISPILGKTADFD
jgi:hypothetical protein